MFPVAIIIATTAMASGVGGATFFSPLFMLALGLPPEVAIGTGCRRWESNPQGHEWLESQLNLRWPLLFPIRSSVTGVI
jgi:hypothetical protein